MTNSSIDRRPWPAVVLQTATLCALAVAALCAACSSETPPATPRGVVEKHAVFDGLQYRGVALQINTGLNAVETYVPLLTEIAGLGADSVLICSAGYMEHARAQAIFIDALKTPSQRDFVTILQEARKLNLRVILMPIVLLRYPRGSEWRGVIEPPEWADWWRDYRDFLKYFADIARDGQADLLMVGSELVSTEKYTSEWVKVIELARDRFRGGKLGYSANWDHYDPVKFWDKLDYVGMTSYYTLADRKNPSVDEIAKKWQPIRDDILKWQRKIGKPVILTEVGWCSQEGAATAPWNYYQNQNATTDGHEEQRRLYEGFLKAWNGSAGLAGVMWWEWSPGHGGASDFNYTPKNKPAEQVLRKWFADQRGLTSGKTTESSEGEQR